MNLKKYFIIDNYYPNLTDKQREIYGVTVGIILIIIIIIYGYYTIFENISFKAELMLTLFVANCYIYSLIFIYKLLSPEYLERKRKSK